MPVEAKSFDRPDETVTYPHGRLELVRVGSLTLGREVAEAGWRWSEHIKPIAGTEWCEFHHVVYVMSGRVHVLMRDGETRAVEPGVVADIPPGHDAWVLGDEAAVFLDILGATGFGKPEPGERILTTVLFTDIVGSTVRAELLGDAAWKRVLGTHGEDVRAMVTTHRGRVVNTTGDGFVATFDSPGRAIRCGLDIASAAERLGIEIRAGVHTGEVEFVDDDIRGLAVHLAARVMDAAAPGTTLVTATTRELTMGAGIEFVDQGRRTFKGIGEERQVFEARLAGG